MKDQATREEFIRLRAEGYSFAKIVEQINVSKPTLIKWSRQYSKEITTETKRWRKQLKAEETDAQAEAVDHDNGGSDTGIGVVKVTQDLQFELDEARDELGKVTGAMARLSSEKMESMKELRQHEHDWPTLLGKVALREISRSEKTKIKKQMGRLKEELEDCEIAQRWLIQRRKGAESAVRRLTAQFDVKQRALDQYNEIKERFPETCANGQRGRISSEKAQLTDLAKILNLQDDLEKLLVKFEAA